MPHRKYNVASLYKLSEAGIVAKLKKHNHYCPTVLTGVSFQKKQVTSGWGDKVKVDY